MSAAGLGNARNPSNTSRPIWAAMQALATSQQVATLKQPYQNMANEWMNNAVICFVQIGIDRIGAVDDSAAVDSPFVRQALSWRDADVGGDAPHDQEWNQGCCVIYYGFI